MRSAHGRWGRHRSSIARWAVLCAVLMSLIGPDAVAAQVRKPRPVPGANRALATAQTYSVTIDTSTISGKAGKLVFDVTADGSASNIVDILDFNTDGKLGLPETLGGFIQGDLILGSNPAALTEITESAFGTSYFFTELAVNFTSFGKSITFQFTPTESFLAGHVPDQLSMFLLDASGSALIPTADPLGANALLSIDIDGTPGGHVTPFSPTLFSPPSTFLVNVQNPPPVALLSSPARLVDTRQLGPPITAGTDRCFVLAGLGEVPADAAGIVVNATAVGQTTNGWVTLYPAGQTLPETSTLNFGTTEYAMANGTIMRLGAGGQVCVHIGTVNSVPGTAHVILDATGYVPSSLLTQLTMLPAPLRLADTRTSGGAVNSGATRCFPVGGVSGIPADAAVAILNVTAVGYSTNGWLTTFPNGQSLPATSTVNFDGSEYAMANNAIVRIGAGGQVCVNVGTVNSTPGSSQIILDAVGYVPAAGLAQMPMLTSPQRVVDTRASGGPINTGTSRCFTLAGVAGVPSNASGVVVNVTAVGYGVQGWVTAYPAGQTVPSTSTLNFDTTEYAMANGAIIALAGSQLCANVGTVNSAPGSSQVILDVVGYLP